MCILCVFVLKRHLLRSRFRPAKAVCTCCPFWASGAGFTLEENKRVSLKCQKRRCLFEFAKIPFYRLRPLTCCHPNNCRQRIFHAFHIQAGSMWPKRPGCSGPPCLSISPTWDRSWAGRRKISHPNLSTEQLLESEGTQSFSIFSTSLYQPCKKVNWQEKELKEAKEKADNFHLHCSSACAVPRRRVLPAVTSIQQLPVAVVAEVALVGPC